MTTDESAKREGAELPPLLPCPFCGGPVALERARSTRDPIYGERKWWGVTCRNTINRGGTCAIEAIPRRGRVLCHHFRDWNVQSFVGRFIKGTFGA